MWLRSLPASPMLTRRDRRACWNRTLKCIRRKGTETPFCHRPRKRTKPETSLPCLVTSTWTGKKLRRKRKTHKSRGVKLLAAVSWNQWTPKQCGLLKGSTGLKRNRIALWVRCTRKGPRSRFTVSATTTSPRPSSTPSTTRSLYSTRAGTSTNTRRRSVGSTEKALLWLSSELSIECQLSWRKIGKFWWKRDKRAV